jgi:hypothetical protein
MFLQPRHDFNEIAGPISNIKLMHQNFIPAIAASAR